MPQHWFEKWHGVKLPASAVEGISTGVVVGGSTAISTGVTLALSTKAGVGHAHAISEVSGLSAQIAGLTSAISTKAAGSHGHAQSEVTGLADALSTKAGVGHGHAQGDVTGLDTALSGKAASVHAHGTTNVTGLDGTLAGLSAGISSKADASHGHAAADGSAAGFCPQLPANSTTYLRSDGQWGSPPAGGAGGGIPSTWVKLSTHVLTGSTTMQTATGLAFAVSSGATYRFEFVVASQTISSATGIAFGVNGPASPLMLVYETAISTGLGGGVFRAGRAFGVQTIASAGSSAANINSIGYLGGILLNGANAGTLQLQFASEVNGSTVSLRAGSVGLLFGPL